MDVRPDSSARSLWDSVPCPLWIGTASGMGLGANRAFCEWSGAAEANILGTQWLELLDPSARKPALEWFHRLGSQRRQFRVRLRLLVRGRVRSVRADARRDDTIQRGSPRWIVSFSHGRARASESQAPPTVAKRSAEDDLTQETLRLCFEHVPVGIGFLDLELRCVRSNPAFSEILADGGGEIEGTPLGTILAQKVPPEAAVEIERVCNETILSGVPHALHGWPTASNRPGNSPRVADWEIRRIQTTKNIPVGLLVTVNDVTQQKLVQERLRLLASVLESTPDFVAILSIEGDVLYLNKSAREAARVANDDSVHTLHISQLQPEWAVKQLEEEGFPIALQEGTWEGESAFFLNPDSPVPVSQILCAHKNAEGQVEFLSTILRDITEALDIREQLARAHENFRATVEARSTELAVTAALIQEQARKKTEAANVAKNTFLSRISHELRTPLNAILGFTQLLKLESPNSAQLESISLITRAGRHLLSLINELLDIAQIESGRIPLNLESLEMSEFLRSCVEMMRPIAASSSVDMQFISREKAFYARGDRLRLKQVVLNFLSNAIKYNNEGGSVLVSLRLTPTGVRFEVRDTGPGIPESKRNLLFKPFERLGAESSETEGTGIGLALCKGLLEAMGGAIGLENPDGGGCVFWAELPQASPFESRQFKEESLPPSLSFPHPKAPPAYAKILVIESHDFDLQLLEKLLQKKYPESEILIAMQGDLGLELAREHYPDLILLDADLPDLTPAQFLARLRSNAAQAPPQVILIGTGLGSPEYRVLREEHNAEALRKPYKPEELLRLLRGLNSKKV